MNERQLKWELDRERFQIPEPFPPPERRPEKPIGDILRVLLHENEASDNSRPGVVVERWPLLVGDQLAQHTWPSHLNNGILHIYADHPGWLASLYRLSKAHLIKKITSIPGHPQFNDIWFQLDPMIRPYRQQKTNRT